MPKLGDAQRDKLRAPNANDSVTLQQCFSTAIATFDIGEVAYLFPVATPDGTTWTSTVSVGGKEPLFKLDTGAEVTVIGEEAHKALQQPPLQPPSKIWYCPTCESLQVLGKLQQVFHLDKECQRN